MIGGVAGQGLANMVAKPLSVLLLYGSAWNAMSQFLSDKQEEDGSWTNGFIKKNIQ